MWQRVAIGGDSMVVSLPVRSTQSSRGCIPPFLTNSEAFMSLGPKTVPTAYFYNSPAARPSHSTRVVDKHTKQTMKPRA